MSYPVNTNAKSIDLTSLDLDLESNLDCILLDDKPLDLSAVIAKIKSILEETATELGNTKDIDI